MTTCSSTVANTSMQVLTQKTLGAGVKETPTLIAWLFYKPKSSWKIQNPLAFKIQFCFIFSSNPLSSLILPSKILTKQGFDHSDFVVILGKSLPGVIRITFFPTQQGFWAWSVNMILKIPTKGWETHWP